ncbi:MAG: glycosyltransferase family 4 protein [Thermaceae bacterium]
MRLYRIGLFTDVYLPDPNGVSTSVYLLHRELRRMGHEAWVIAPKHPEAPDKEENVVRVPSIPYPFYEGYQVALPNRRYLPLEFELIHTHTPLTLGVWGLRIARNEGIPHVSTFHTHYEKYAHYVPGLAFLDKYTGIIPRLAKAFYNRVEVVITPTEPVRRLAESYGIVRPIRVIPTGIDTRLLREAPLPNPSPWPEGKRRIISVGRLGPEKSFDVVLKAFRRILNEVDAHLVHIGPPGPEAPRLKALAEELGIAEQVSWLGPVPYRSIGGYYRLAELFLFASETETQGLVLWEAQAMGVPVVAVGAEGTLEGVEDGRTGFLVPPQEDEALAKKALELLKGEEKRLRFAQDAETWAMERSAERIAERVVEAYDEAREILRVEPRRLIFPFPRLQSTPPADRRDS